MFGDGSIRRRVLLLCAILAACVAGCLWFARGLPDFRQNLLLNLSPELFTTMITLLIIQPFLSRLEEERAREHLRLDYASFCEKVAQTNDIVEVLDTFSYLFSGRSSERFAEATRSAVNHGAIVRILLLDPDSLAARQRSAELSADVRLEVLRNVRDLRHLEMQLPRERRGQLQVRVYRAAPSIQLYRFGERMMVSFYPVNRLSGEGQQLEVRVSTPLGAFVSERFAELWSSSRPIDDLLRLQVHALDEDGRVAGEPIWVEYVHHDGGPYICDQRMIVELARRRGRPVRVRLGGRADREFELDLVGKPEEALLERLSTAYQEKYGTEADVFVRLLPLGHGIIDVMSADLVASGDTEAECDSDEG